MDAVFKLLVSGILLLGTVAHAQERRMGALAVRDKAPTDRAADLTNEDLTTVANEMPGKNLATTRLLEGGVYSVNIRRLTGPETAHVHPTTISIYVVREGSALLVTGGTIVDAKRQPVLAGRSGYDLRGGVERVVKAGDIIVTPPGVPHLMREVKDHIVFMNILIETK